LIFSVLMIAELVQAAIEQHAPFFLGGAAELIESGEHSAAHQERDSAKAAGQCRELPKGHETYFLESSLRRCLNNACHQEI
jgi:hypothetical protein